MSSQRKAMHILVCALTAFAVAGCGDDGHIAAVTGTPAPTTTTTATTTTVAPLATDAVGGAAAITFNARLMDRDGSPWVEVEFTSDPPPGTALWAVRVNGRISARSNHVPGAVFGFLVAGRVDANMPVEVSVIAETSGRAPLAESVPVMVSS